MTRKFVLGFAVLLFTLVGTYAAEGPAEVSILAGRFAFNWLRDPAKEKCFKIDKKVLDKFAAGYSCNLTEETGTSSGKPQVSCKKKDGSVEWLIFQTKAFCNEERELQAANGE